MNGANFHGTIALGYGVCISLATGFMGLLSLGLTHCTYHCNHCTLWMLIWIPQHPNRFTYTCAYTWTHPPIYNIKELNISNPSAVALRVWQHIVSSFHDPRCCTVQYWGTPILITRIHQGRIGSKVVSLAESSSPCPPPGRLHQRPVISCGSETCLLRPVRRRRALADPQ